MSQTVIDISEILKILPHRYPFLLVDKIISLDIEKGTIVGIKNLTFNENFFQGHFPNSPIMPGVLMLEALAQTGGILAHKKGVDGRVAVLLNMKDVKFRNPVRPGDVLVLRCEGIHFSSKGGKVKAEATVGDKIAAQAEIGFAYVTLDQL